MFHKSDFAKNGLQFLQKRLKGSTRNTRSGPSIYIIIAYIFFILVLSLHSTYGESSIKFIRNCVNRTGNRDKRGKILIKVDSC